LLDERIAFLCRLTKSFTVQKSDFLASSKVSGGHRSGASAKLLKKEAGEAWLSLLSQEVSTHQRKALLALITKQIANSVERLERLSDFIDDSFNIGGSMSLAALAGVYHLMREKNLDYPDFYSKVYALLQPSTLHSKHRSRFLRLLDTFLGSTHLPAALVASFVKRLSRLCLHCAPSAIVAIVPFVYNLLKAHPACTFMIHRRKPIGKGTRPCGTYQGQDDPFVMTEPDPMSTMAIDSSLWEVEALQTHYHPNVATISKVVSEQFTKQAYNLEDFLDHSYASVGFFDALIRIC
jgi:U3 small nucleolar RNA-associated protein 19